MGHGNPDKNYNANTKYTETEEAMQALAANKNVFVGTVDYGDMLFWPEKVNQIRNVSIPNLPNTARITT